MGTGLEADPGRSCEKRSSVLGGLAQGHHLGMRAAGLLGKAFTGEPTLRIVQHAADAGVGFGQADRSLGQLDGAQQQIVIGRRQWHAAGQNGRCS